MAEGTSSHGAAPHAVATNGGGSGIGRDWHWWRRHAHALTDSAPVSPALGLPLAVAAPALATLPALLDERPHGEVMGWLFMLAVALVAFIGGTAPAIVATALSFLSLDYFFERPLDGLGIETANDAAALALFVVAAALVTFLLERRRKSQAVAGRAREQAETEAERLSRLQTVAAKIAEALTPHDVLEAVVEYGVQAAEAVAGVIGIVTPDGDTIEIVAEHGYEPGRLEGWRTFPVDADTPFSDVVRTGEPLFFATTHERDERYPAMRAAVHARSHAFVALPLPVEGRTIGALGLSYAGDVRFDQERETQKMALARLAAQALERARHYEREQQLRERLEFLAEASRLLGSSLDYQATLRRVAELAVPRLADWCTIDILTEEGRIERVATAHQDPEKVRWATELEARYPPDPEAQMGAPAVIRTGTPEFLPDITDELLVHAVQGDDELLEILRGLGLRSAVTVPLTARSRTLGALTLVTGESGRRYGQLDLRLAEDLARRAATAVDNARLYRESEHRGDAARALAYVDDGVVLVDADGWLRFLNPAAQRILGVRDVPTGVPATDALPEWQTVENRLTAGSEALTLPVVVDGEEKWLWISAVDFGEGVVYALRDVTDERSLERERSEFVATASHELRTPVAAIYGAARTLRRPDLELPASTGETLMRIIEEEAERLAKTVEQVLLAGRLDSGELGVSPVPCNVSDVARSVLDSMRLRAPDPISLRMRAPESVVARCDSNRFRQVLQNLVENAIKYSPDGGVVEVIVGDDDGRVRVEVRDEGLGIPPGDEERIFEKFVRLDPAQTKGIGGTGLGLYIARELVERMDGRLWVEQNGTIGSRFVVELPLGGSL